MNAVVDITAPERHLHGHTSLLRDLGRHLTAATDCCEALIAHRTRNDHAIHAAKQALGFFAAQQLSDKLGREEDLERLLGERFSGSNLGRLIYSARAQSHYRPFASPIPNALKPESSK